MDSKKQAFLAHFPEFERRFSASSDKKLTIAIPGREKVGPQGLLPERTGNEVPLTLPGMPRRLQMSLIFGGLAPGICSIGGVRTGVELPQDPGARRPSWRF
jgi:hypothetical protein